MCVSVQKHKQHMTLFDFADENIIFIYIYLYGGLEKSAEYCASTRTLERNRNRGSRERRRGSEHEKKRILYEIVCWKI